MQLHTRAAQHPSFTRPQPVSTKFVIRVLGTNSFSSNRYDILHSTPLHRLLNPQSSILGSLLACIRLSRVTSSHTYKRQVYTLHKREARRMGFGEDNAHHPKLPCPIVTKIAHLPCFETGIARNRSPSSKRLEESPTLTEYANCAANPLSKETSPSRNSLPKNRSVHTHTHTHIQWPYTNRPLPKG